MLTVIFFAIYKAYFMSNEKQKTVDIGKILTSELREIIYMRKIRDHKQNPYILKLTTFYPQNK